jgi:hypothetical protein
VIQLAIHVENDDLTSKDWNSTMIHIFHRDLAVKTWEINPLRFRMV